MAPDENSSAEPAWQPIGTIERRVLGVLVEKAKTTPDAYPLTLNAITTGANQKSNRSPLMNLDPIDVENALENLRRLGAVSEIHGSGRTAKYRHRFYEWLGVEKLEAAVMAELLLRGEQTIGELRGRASRMGKIADVGELRPILQSLIDKGLVQALTPAGRGQIVTHCLYLPEQQDKLQRNHGLESGAADSFSLDEASGPSSSSSTSPAANDSSAHRNAEATREPVSPNASPVDSGAQSAELDELRAEIEVLQETVRSLEKRLENLEQLVN